MQRWTSVRLETTGSVEVKAALEVASIVVSVIAVAENHIVSNIHIVLSEGRV